MPKIPIPASSRDAKRQRTFLLVSFAVLTALEAIVCFTPLGSLPIGPLAATFSHIPVIFAAILLGPVAGGLMGSLFGLFSLIVWTIKPPNAAIAFLFTPLFSAPGVPQGNIWSLLICFVPRILIGVVAGLVFAALKKAPKSASMSSAAVLGTLTNTLLVLSGVFVFFPAMRGEGQGLLTFIIAMAGWNGLLEIVTALILTAPVCIAVQKAVKVN
ncbi:MAG: ECF transporter S component [Oscillospiraceae bacterium]|nr:ECF transporter S component [Oscillospiraceae bacterium]